MYSLLFLLAAITRVSNALEGFDAGCLASHNQYRAKHGAPPLMWSESLAAAAQKWADSLARENIMEHDPSNKDQGENLAYFTNPRPRCKGEKKTECVHCSEMVDDWYNEVKDYDFNTGESKNGGAILHFTQVVWKETRELGMATAVGRKYGFITVGRYSPRGNMGYAEDFKKNVLPTGSQPPQPPPSSTLTPQIPTTSSSGGPLPRPAQVSNALEGFDAGCLASHNQYRAKHGAPPLMWSESLAAAAQKWADSLARENIMEHDPSNKDQGENLAYFTNPRPRCKGEKKTECVHCSEMVDDWYKEVKDYDFNTGESKNGGAILHFTQVVWKETRELGMATAVGRKYGFITVGRYSPRGNMGYAEDFKKNVLPPGSQPPQPPPSSTLTPQIPTTSSSGGPLPRPAQVSNTLNFFDANCLASHNQYRAKHGAPPLIWSESLAAGAQKWADYLAENSLFKHDVDTINKEQVGENLAWFKPPRDKCMSTTSTDCVHCSEMVADWYNEVKNYTFSTGKGKFPNAVILHFTQVVWKDTKELGVGTAVSKSNRFITVARYSPRGNMGNEEDFRKNVLPEGSLPPPITLAQTLSPSTRRPFPRPQGSLPPPITLPQTLSPSTRRPFPRPQGKLPPPITLAQTLSPSTRRPFPRPQGSLPPPITLAQTLSPSTRRPFPRPQGKLPPPITLAQTLSPSTRRPFPRPQGEKCEYLIVITANKKKKIIEMCKGKRNQTYVPEETTRPTTVLTTPAPTTAPPSKTEASTSASTAATTAAATTTSSTTTATTATTAATTAAPTTTATTATTAATTEATTAAAPTTSASTAATTTAATTTAATTAATTSSATTEATTATASLSNPSPTVPTTSMEQAGQAPTEEPQLMDQQHKAVVLVNLYRAMHGAHPLIPSTRLTQEAQSWAEQLAKTGQLSHDSSTTDGENIAMVKAGGQDVTRAIDYWYDEEKQYDFNKRDFSKATGHFTQLVWKSTQEIGIGIAPSKDNSQYYIVARFRPPGNIKGRFETNVAREKVIR